MSIIFFISRCTDTIRCSGHRPLCVCRIVNQMNVTYYGETKMASKHFVAPKRFAVMVSVLFAFDSGQLDAYHVSWRVYTWLHGPPICMHLRSWFTLKIAFRKFRYAQLPKPFWRYGTQELVNLHCNQHWVAVCACFVEYLLSLVSNCHFRCSPSARAATTKIAKTQFVGLVGVFVSAFCFGTKRSTPAFVRA